MNAAVAVLALSLQMTVPTATADSGCVASHWNIPDAVASITVWRVAGPDTMPVLNVGVLGLGGQVVVIDVPELPGVYFVRAHDVAGNQSCASNAIEVPGWVGVGDPGVPQPPPAAPLRIYDVAGRRVREPLRSGVYFVRGPTGTRRLLVIR